MAAPRINFHAAPSAGDNRVLTAGTEYRLTFDAMSHVERFEIDRRGETKEAHSDTISIPLKPKTDMTLREAVQEAFLNWVAVASSNNSKDKTLDAAANIHVWVNRGERLQELFMGRQHLLYKYLDKTERLGLTDRECVIDTILRASNAHPDTRHKLLSRAGLKTDTDLGFVEGKGCTTEGIMNWAKAQGNVAAYALTIHLECFMKHVPEGRSRMSIFFVVSDSHCWGVSEATMRASISNCKHKVQCCNLGDLRCSGAEMESAEYLTADKLQDFLDSHKDNMPEHIVVDSKKLYDVMQECMEVTGCMPQRFNYSDDELTAFEHPVYSCTIHAGEGYGERKRVADFLYKTYGSLLEFKWRNQSMGQLARAWCDVQTTRALPADPELSPEWQDIFEECGIAPLRSKSEECAALEAADPEFMPPVSIDTKRCYTDILLRNAIPWSLPGPFDCSIERTDAIPWNSPGEFLVTLPFTLGDPTLRCNAGWTPSNLVCFAVTHGFLPVEHVTRYMAPRQTLPADFFVKFVKFATETPELHEHAKTLPNHLVGILGSNRRTTEKAAITQCEATALATMAFIEETGRLPKLNIVQDSFIVRAVDTQVKSHSHKAIWRQVIAASAITLAQMWMAVKLPGTRLLGCNTDALKLHGEYDSSAVKEKSQCKIGQYHLEPPKKLIARVVSSQPTFVPPPHRDAPSTVLVTAPPLEFLQDHSCLVTGGAGTGKTTLLVKLALGPDGKQRDDTVVLAYQNSVVSKLRKDIGASANVSTFSAFFFQPGTEKMDFTRLKGYRRVLLDEYFGVPPAEMNLIRLAVQAYGTVLVAFGDSHQTTAPCNDWIDYNANPLFRAMTRQTQIELQFIEGCARFDASLHASIEELKTTGKITHGFSVHTGDEQRHVAMTNKHRAALNELCFVRELAGREAITLKGKDKELRVCEGLEYMCYDGKLKPQGVPIVKMDVVTLTEVRASSVRVLFGAKELTIPTGQFASLFEPVYSGTVYKYQGMEISQPYVVHVDGMKKRELYVAFSRARRAEDVRIAGTLPERVLDEPQPVSSPFEFERRTKISDASVYRITTPDGVYIGITTTSLSQRWEEHQAAPVNARMKAALAKPGCRMSLLETVKFVTKRALLAHEKHRIQSEVKAGETVLNSYHGSVPPPAREPATLMPARAHKVFAVKETNAHYRVSGSVGGVPFNKFFKFGTRVPQAQALAAATAYAAAQSALA